MFKRSQGLPHALAHSPFHVLESMRSAVWANDQQKEQALQPYASQPLAGQEPPRYHRLREVERKIRKTLDLPTIFGTTVVEAAALFDAYQVVLIQFDELQLGNCRQVTRYCQNQSLAWQRPFDFSQTDFALLLALLRQGRPICLSETDKATGELMRSHPTLSRDIQTWQARWAGNWLLTPIQKVAQNGFASTLDSQCWGIFALALADGQDWPNSTLYDTQSIVLELSAAMAHSFQYQELLTTNHELQKLALSDGLTSLANRRRFDKYIEDEWQRLARDRQPLSLILCDIDHFKLFNDTFGHPAGDRCLIHIARTLLKVPQRPADLVARYGGEEFAIVLPNTDTRGAWRIAQNIHESLQSLRIAHATSSTEPYVTMTMGVSTVIPTHSDTTQTLIRAADIALYYAKQQGRNRTYVHGHHNTLGLTDATRKAESSTGANLKLTPSE